MEWYIAALKKYVDFNGRARRKEYWMFFFFNIIISIAFGIVDGMLGIALFGLLYSLAVFIPGIAVTVRRLHDIDRSGWWVLIVFVPFVGLIVLFIFTLLSGDCGDNNYGSDPKQIEA